MVEARFKRDGVRNTLTVTGHATGSEATCAAVSCLVQVLETALDYLDEEACLIELWKKIGGGRAEISALGGPAVRAAFETARRSFMRLAAADPERVRVIEEEDNDEL